MVPIVTFDILSEIEAFNDFVKFISRKNITDAKTDQKIPKENEDVLSY